MVTLVNRAKMSTSTTGTGTITLGSVVDGYQTFAAAGVADADVVRYVIEDGDAWEIGLGTYTASGTTLTRQVSESSAGGSEIDLSGEAIVFVAAGKEEFLSVPKVVTSNGQLDLSAASYFTASLTADTYFEPINTSGAGVAKEALLEISGSTITRNSDVNNAEPLEVTKNLNDFVFALSCTAFRFSSDGLKLFAALGNTGGPVEVHEFDLSTAFDVTTLSYSGVFFSDFNAWGFGAVTSLALSTDGLRLFVGNRFDGQVAEYALATAFSLASVTYTTTATLNNQFGVDGVRFSSDGTKMFALEQSSGNVYSYALSTAFDLTSLNASATASYNISNDVASGQPVFIDFSPSGDTLVVGIVDSPSNFAIQYSLGTAFDISTLSLDANATVNFASYAHDFDFFNSGNSALFLGDGGLLTEYVCPDSYSIQGSGVRLVEASVSPAFSISAMRLSPDGTKMFVSDYTETVYQFSLSTAYDLLSATYDSVSATAAGSDYDFLLSNDGLTLITVDRGTDKLKQFSLGAAFDLSSVTAGVEYALDTNVIEDSIKGAFNADGSVLWLSGRVPNSFDPFTGLPTRGFFKYSFTTPFDLSTISYAGVFVEANIEGGNAPFVFSHDGKRVFEFGFNSVVELFLPTPYDIAGAAQIPNTFNFSSEISTIKGAAFSAAGDKLFLGGVSESTFQPGVVAYDASVTDLPLVVFPSSFKFPGGTAPSGPTSANEPALFSLSTSDEGTTFLCRKIGDFS